MTSGADNSTSSREGAAPDAGGLLVLMPVYNDWESLQKLLARLEEVAGGLGRPVDVLVVDDGSTDPPPARIEAQLRAIRSVRVLELRRNLGHQRAIAIGLAYVNPGRAWRDLRSLFEAQWPDGRVPHIVFDPSTAEGDYFPGPAFWDVPAYARRPARGSTGLVQPPLHALAAWEVYRHAAAHGAAAVQQALTELEWLYPRLVAQQEYFATRRDAGGSGLAAIVHPWESGLDTARPGTSRSPRCPRTWTCCALITGGTWTSRTPRTGPPTATTRAISAWS